MKPMNYSDHHVINSDSHFDVLGAPHTVQWHDGSGIELHGVQVHGSTQPFLRALRHAGYYWAVIDMRKVCATIEPDLRILPPRDHPGAVLYNLRADYRNAAAFTLAAIARAEALWAAFDTHAVATAPMVQA